MLAQEKSNGWANSLLKPKLSTDIYNQYNLEITGTEIEQQLKKDNLYQDSDRGGKTFILLAIKCKCCAHMCLPSVGLAAHGLAVRAIKFSHYE